jgi:hypothetical protein
MKLNIGCIRKSGYMFPQTTNCKLTEFPMRSNKECGRLQHRWAMWKNCFQPMHIKNVPWNYCTWGAYACCFSRSSGNQISAAGTSLTDVGMLVEATVRDVLFLLPIQYRWVILPLLLRLKDSVQLAQGNKWAIDSNVGAELRCVGECSLNSSSFSATIAR